MCKGQAKKEKNTNIPNTMYYFNILPTIMHLKQINLNPKSDFFLGEFQDVDEKETLKNRQVKHYGFEFNYTTNDIGNISITTPLLSFQK